MSKIANEVAKQVVMKPKRQQKTGQQAQTSTQQHLTPGQISLWRQ